jgi:hypothetical protein
MSNNLATLLVGFGLDLSALQKDAPEAFRILNSQMQTMSAEMKRASREGAESFRLIDESLGIHISRPLTRILTQEFPAFASTLQSLLGAGVVGALGAVAFETFEKASKGIENAKKALEDYGVAIEHTQNVIGDLSAAHVRAMKEISLGLAALSGDAGAKLQLAEFKIDTAQMEEAKKLIGEITKAIDEQAKAAEKAHGFWVQLVDKMVTGPSDFWSKVFGGAEETTSKLKEVDSLITLIMRQHAGDPMKGLQDSLKEVSAQAKSTFSELYSLQLANAALETKLQGGSQGVSGAIEEHTLAAGKAKADALAQVLIGLNTQTKAIKDAIDEAMGRDKIDSVTAGLERQKKAAAGLSSLYKDMEAALAQLYPQTDPMAKIGQEIEAMVHKAELDFIALRNTTDDALQLKVGRQALLALKEEADQLKNALEGAVLADQLSNLKIPAPAGAATPMSIAMTPVMPQLGVSGLLGAELDAFSADTAAKSKLLAQAFQDAISPAEEYGLKVQELKIAFSTLTPELRASQAAQQAFAAEMEKLGDQATKASLHLQEMQKELEKLLSHSTSAADGIRAFYLQLQIESSENGKFAFDLLNQGLKGFEDELTKAVFTGKAKWAELFRSMEEQAFKFMLDKDIAMLFKMIGGTPIGHSLGGLFGQNGTQQPPAPALPPTAPGSSTGIGALVPSSASGTTMQTAATALQTASSQLQTAAAQLQAAAQSLQSSGSAGGGGGGTDSGWFGGGGADDSDVAGYAGGTDDAPGGLAWVGEQGPELLNLPGGSSVTPAASLRMGGGDQHFYIDAKGAEIGVEDKIVRALTVAKPSIIAEAMMSFREVQKRTPPER